MDACMGSDSDMHVSLLLLDYIVLYSVVVLYWVLNSLTSQATPGQLMLLHADVQHWKAGDGPYGVPNVTKIRERHHMLYHVILRCVSCNITRSMPRCHQKGPHNIVGSMSYGDPSDPVILQVPSHDIMYSILHCLWHDVVRKDPVILLGWCQIVVRATPQYYAIKVIITYPVILRDPTHEVETAQVLGSKVI